MSFGQCSGIEVLLKPPPTTGILPGGKIPGEEYLWCFVCLWHVHIPHWDTGMWQYVVQVHKHTLQVIMANLHRQRIQPQGVPESGADGGQVQKKLHLWYL